MKLTKFKYLILYIIILIAPLSFVAIGSYIITSMNHIALKTYYTYYGGMSLSFASIVILGLTWFLIKQYFPKKEETLDNKVLLKINLIFAIFHLLISIISNLLNYYHIPNYFIYSLYLFYPLLYFCIILFGDREKFSQKNVINILASIYLLWYLLIPLVIFIFNNPGNINLIVIKSLLYNLLYHYLQFILLVIPFITLGLIKITEESKEKSLIHKFSFSIKKLCLITGVLGIIAILVILMLNR